MYWTPMYMNIHVEIKSTKVSIFMPIPTDAGVYFTLETQQIDSNS